MAVKTELDLPENLRSSWLKALTAYELKNFGYAISLLQSILKVVPEFLEARRLLRQAEIAKTRGKKSFLGTLSLASISSMKLQGLVKKDPTAAMEAAEKLLENEPSNQSANLIIRDAAMALDMPETAAFALETLKDAYPKDAKLLHIVARHYYENNEPQKAVDLYTRITELNPSDLEAIKLGKNASARASMTGGGWEVATSYRDLINNKEEAILLEQKNRVTKSDDIIDSQLADLGRRHSEQPDSIDVARSIAGLYEQKGDLDNAQAWYFYASGLAQGSDPVLLRKASEMELKRISNRVNELRSWLKEAGEDHPEAAGVLDEIATLDSQMGQARLAEAKRNVERNPTDLSLRLELGLQLMKVGQLSEAIPELQQARRSSSARYKAMLLLGHCYVQKNMVDLAIKQLEEASNELKAMDDTKKEIVYNLGLVYETVDRMAESLDCMKMIYDVDYGYKDVARRVESSYGAQG